jgi:hypothetical protein
MFQNMTNDSMEESYQKVRLLSKKFYFGLLRSSTRLYQFTFQNRLQQKSLYKFLIQI